MRLYFFYKGCPFSVVSYGENMVRQASCNKWTTHAEDNAIRKLPVMPRKKNLKKVDLLVIRTSKTGMLGNSKPCIHCLILLQNKLPEKGYKLQTVYYTDTGGVIHETSLRALLADEDNMHVSRYYREHNYHGIGAQ